MQDELTEIGKQRHLEFNVALNPSPKAPVKFHFKIDGRHEKVLNRTDGQKWKCDVASREGWNPFFHGLIYFFSTSVKETYPKPSAGFEY